MWLNNNIRLKQNPLLVFFLLVKGLMCITLGTENCYNSLHLFVITIIKSFDCLQMNVQTFALWSHEKANGLRANRWIERQVIYTKYWCKSQVWMNYKCIFLYNQYSLTRKKLFYSLRNHIMSRSDWLQSVFEALETRAFTLHINYLLEDLNGL